MSLISETHGPYRMEWVPVYGYWAVKGPGVYRKCSELEGKELIAILNGAYLMGYADRAVDQLKAKEAA
jgi:hypothetical protein